MPTPNELRDLYRASWTDPSEHREETGDTAGATARRYVDGLEAHLHDTLSGKHILDYRAGRGAFASAVAARGANVLCYEPFGAELLRRRGFDACADLGSIAGQFDGIVALGVIEHLRAPRDFVHWCFEHLRDHG